MTEILLTLVLLAQPPPPDVDAAIRAYYAQQEHNSQQEDVRERRTVGVIQAPPTPRDIPLAVPGAAPRILALIRPGSTAPLTQATPGEPLILLGEGLPTNGRVIIAHREAVVTKRTATSYELSAPRAPQPSTLPLTGPVDLFVGSTFTARLTNSFTLVLTPPAIDGTLTGQVVTADGRALRVIGPVRLEGTRISGQVETSPVPAPEPIVRAQLLPHVSDFRDAAGNALAQGEKPYQVFSGDTLTILGQGFGSGKGKVWINSATEADIVSWADTAITIRLPLIGGTPKRMQVGLRTGSGSFYTGLTWLLLSGKR